MVKKRLLIIPHLSRPIIEGRYLRLCPSFSVLPTWGRGRQKSKKRADVFYEWSPSAQTHSSKPLLGSTWQKNEIFSLMLSSMGYFKPIFHLKSRNNLWSNWLFNKLVIAIWQKKKVLAPKIATSAQTHSPLLGSTWQKSEIFSLTLSSMGFSLRQTIMSGLMPKPQYIY